MRHPGRGRFAGSAAGLALALWPALAFAVIGGQDDPGPLARRSVMVLDSRGGVCSGVVLARDVVLTAAHCVTGAPEHRVHFRDAGGQPVLIVPSAKAVHPGYDATAIERRRRSIDLALVRLPEPLPARIETATLAAGAASKDERIVLGGWGVLREGESRTTGTFRTASLDVVEPFGPSRILLWAQDPDRRGVGACRGDSGGPITRADTVLAVTTWASGPKGRDCGTFTQGVLVAPQRDWIDRTLKAWGREAAWE
ncbi:trypsin-like serine protease [Salinarimonas soli]|uniref:Trypsin-like serine protease n=2 Tax=Salinarimonas soli TaxID=1638099 RepID=A0A5B2VF64_9HYPH|nr:trypsin-like serine protease [Salinarimonas soli]